MANNVEVVLKKDIPDLGQTGEMVSVKLGYARNYLIPKGLVAVAGSKEAAEILKTVKDKKEEKKEIAKIKEEKKIVLTKKTASNHRKEEKIIIQKNKKVI